ncbi:hypothetical protein [Tunturibacter empetritectus]|uniref:Uncharacterized protein n=2 Tax=Tunturiibacter empetritectus TaxID=3069691 RepID=A0A7W8MS95_9BACT|nr:hypothetical protein [Edaphobacter lichenicola]MBB5318448.1 hypothetical protein [Edaphobacter lichenicola]
MKRRTFLFAALFLPILPATWSQQLGKRITNKDVIDMVGLGLSDDIIITKIRSAAAGGTLQFDTSVDSLKELKAAKVSDEVIKVMINPAPPAAPVVVAATPISNDPGLPPPEVGVYWKNSNAFVLIEGQAISQAKVGGKAGSMFTYGMRNEHWDAYLNGPQSKNVINDRQPVFYLYVPDGASASDFILIILEKKGNRREFQIGSFGGITGGKSGVKRDKEVAFTAEHAGIRTYKIKLDAAMKPGEYAFFMGTGQQATMAGGSTGGARSGGAAAGRIYDFRIPE